MKNTLIYTAAFIAAIITVLGTRLLIPALTILFRAIEASYVPEEPTPVNDEVCGPNWYHLLKEGVSAEDLIASVEADADEVKQLPVSIEEIPEPTPTPKKRATRTRKRANTKTKPAEGFATA